MNIMHILDERWDSGITNYGIALAKEQKRLGHNVVIACLPNSPAELQSKENNFEVFLLGIVNNIFKLKSFVKEKNIQIIHTHTGKGNLIGYLVKNDRLKLIRSRGDIRPIKKSIFNEWLINNTDRVICAAEFIKDNVVNTYPKIKDIKISVVYQGIDTNPHINQDNINIHTPAAIGIIGRLDPVKGHMVFINAARIILEHFPETKFLIAGREANIKWTELFETMNRLSIADSFEYKGFVKNKFDFIKTVDIGIVASVGSEAISRAALEWMVSGKVLIASRTGCLGEIIDDNLDGLLFDPGNHEMLASKCLDLLKNPDRMLSLRKNAIEKVKREFSLDMFVSKVHRIYNDS
ncbi:MAG: glycosyltransferase family 4 protein [bacterium]